MRCGFLSSFLTLSPALLPVSGRRESFSGGGGFPSRIKENTCRRGKLWFKPRQPAGVGVFMGRGHTWRGPSAAAAGYEPLRWNKQWERRRRRLAVAFVISLRAPFLSWFGSAAPLVRLFIKKKRGTQKVASVLKASWGGDGGSVKGLCGWRGSLWKQWKSITSSTLTWLEPHGSNKQANQRNKLSCLVLVLNSPGGHFSHALLDVFSVDLFVFSSSYRQFVASHYTAN